jgi:hypothetical protein
MDPASCAVPLERIKKYIFIGRNIVHSSRTCIGKGLPLSAEILYQQGFQKKNRVPQFPVESGHR